MPYYLRPSGVTLSSPLYNSGTALTLSDHGRAPIEYTYERIENRKRMVNGTMRSYYIADKRRWAFSWDRIPSRSSGANGIGGSSRYTADGYAGANQMRDFYEAVPGSFTMKLYVDDTSVGADLFSEANGAELDGGYTVYFSDFTMTVEKRGSLFDLCSVSFSLEQA